LSASPKEIPGRESKIILIPLQIGGFALTAFYMSYRWSELRRRNRRSWQQIVSRLSPGWNGTSPVEPGDNSPLSGTNLWTVYRDTGVIMELADYAQCHGRDFDVSSVRELRFTALSLRFEVLRALARRISLR
jgi:hypothetical protein